MKKLLLIPVLFAAVMVQAQEKPKQSLKDLLYSGKLKKDSSGVIRSTDDLSQKIDTSTKKQVISAETVKPVEKKAEANAPANTSNIISDTAVAVDNTEAVTTASAPSAKTNTKIWKEYTDNLVKEFGNEILKSKQLKKGIYFVLIDYAIETDGAVTINSVVSTPENAFLQAQVKQYLDTNPVKLNPVAKKVNRRQQFTISKD